MSALLFDQRVLAASPRTVQNLPAGGDVQIVTASDLEVEYWDDVTKSYFPPVEVTAPGGYLGTPTTKARITVSADTTVRILTNNAR
jgi:hypothetical protein